MFALLSGSSLPKLKEDSSVLSFVSVRAINFYI